MFKYVFWFLLFFNGGFLTGGATAPLAPSLATAMFNWNFPTSFIGPIYEVKNLSHRGTHDYLESSLHECLLCQFSGFAESLAVVLRSPAIAVEVDILGLKAERTPFQDVCGLAVQHPNPLGSVRTNGLRLKDDSCTSSHYLTYTFIFKRLRECTFWAWDWKG